MDKQLQHSYFVDYLVSLTTLQEDGEPNLVDDRQKEEEESQVKLLKKKKKKSKSEKPQVGQKRKWTEADVEEQKATNEQKVSVEKKHKKKKSRHVE